MTEHWDLLEILAQVFVAFAGFAGVIAAFSKIRLSPEATTFRVRALVTLSLVSLVMSLLPFFVKTFFISEVAVFRISAFVAALVMSGFSLWSFRQLSSLYSARQLDTQTYAMPLLSVGAIFIVVLFAVSGGLFHDLSVAIYLGGLFYNLVVCSYFFVMVIFAVEMRTRE